MVALYMLSVHALHAGVFARRRTTIATAIASANTEPPPRMRGPCEVHTCLKQTHISRASGFTHVAKFLIPHAIELVTHRCNLQISRVLQQSLEFTSSSSKAP
ncbi:hypothetical protein BAAA27536_07250 [Bifidobacterium animalis subsp. lactis ATCC 27536]|nr:hypothetical protein BAAA27536_07250 [Bifidobacterium animalis subsp. lactis ATCC 27536]